MTDFFKHSLEVYFAENPQSADKICSQVLVNKRSRESAENMRVNVKKKLTTSLDINNSVDKFVNCRSKDPSRCELYIVEGRLGADQRQAWRATRNSKPSSPCAAKRSTV